MLLGQQLCIARVQFQKFFYILKLGLRGLDFFVYICEGLGKPGSITVDLNRDAFDTVCHARPPP